MGLASYSTNLHYRALPSETVHLAKHMMIDTIACALGGYHSLPSQIARDVAATITSAQPCTVIGSGQTTSPGLATFANGVMIRYLDFNDGYTSKESGHPSDSIAAVLTASELARASGKRAITTTVLAYEVLIVVKSSEEANRRVPEAMVCKVEVVTSPLAAPRNYEKRLGKAEV